MKKNPWLVVLVLVLVVTGGVIGIRQFYLRSPARPDFDKVGGTILVYEIDRGHDNKEPDADLTASMTKALESRLGFAWVRPLDKGRVEIRIPRSGEKHEDDVQRVKDLVAQTGLLEFRILANSVDDREAIKDVQEMINVRAENDAAFQKELKQLQEKGLPPPGPRKIGAKEPTVYEIQLAKNNKSLLTYGWVELGPQERRLLGLDNAAEKDPERNKTWLEAKKSRGKATTLKDPSTLRAACCCRALFFTAESARTANCPKRIGRSKASNTSSWPAIRKLIRSSLKTCRWKNAAHRGSMAAGSAAPVVRRLAQRKDPRSLSPLAPREATCSAT